MLSTFRERTNIIIRGGSLEKQYQEALCSFAGNHAADFMCSFQ
jgi:hypothetical protein